MADTLLLSQRNEKPVTQELAASSGTPPAFRKQLELCCICPHSHKSASADGEPAELRCGVPRCVKLRNQWWKSSVSRSWPLGLLSAFSCFKPSWHGWGLVALSAPDVNDSVSISSHSPVITVVFISQ